MLSPESLILQTQAEAFSKTLLSWFKFYRRQLPWRESPSLYKTVVSEFMLQQTQVDTVLPYFNRWLIIFPDFEALAKAEESFVVKHWEGLGYYSRARNLHKLAKAYVNAEAKPISRDDWLQFPGIGPYTSAAITSIALGQANAVVDGNVIRILARLANVQEAFKDNTTAMKAFSPLAQSIISHEEPGFHNEAMMELGATVCTKANPQCLLCPVNSFCHAKNPESLPKLLPKKTTNHEIHRLLLIQNNQLLLHKIPNNSKRLANILELPEIEEITAKNGNLLAIKKRGISNQRITEYIYQFNESPIQLAETFHWLEINDIKNHTLSGPHKKWINELLKLKIDIK